MKKKRSAVLVVMSFFVALAFAQSEDQKGGSTERDRVKDSGQALKEILGTPDGGIPNSVLDGAKCVIILPSVKKVAIGIGGSYGRGVMTCRTGADYKGPWSAPIMMASSGGSVGLQIGGESTDFVITVMNDGGARSLLSSKVKLGADASVAAGPVGRTAEA
jgi:lipid-binding SYLF domain-containing protein